MARRSGQEYKDRSLVKVWLHCSKKETSHFRTMMKQCIAPLLTVQVHIHSEIKMEKSTMQDCAIAKNAIHHSEAGPLDFFKRTSKLVFFRILGLQCEADPKKR